MANMDTVNEYLGQPRPDEDKYDPTYTADPAMRTYYEKPTTYGEVYADGNGRERCTAQWAWPCPICHRSKNPAMVRTMEVPIEQTNEEISVRASLGVTTETRRVQVVGVNATEEDYLEAERDHEEPPPGQGVYVYR